jgi:CheY-like chemotaxis protein
VHVRPAACPLALPQNPWRACGLARVVDDNPTNRRMLAAFLHGWNARPTVVEAARSPDSPDGYGRRAVQARPMDGSMPGMDGFAVVERMRASRPLPAIMLLTSDAHGMQLAQCGNSAWPPPPEADFPPSC